MIEVTLYSRTDCHLCEVAQEDLEALQEEYPHKLTIVDVDSSQKLRREYGFEVPVVTVGPYRLKAPFTQKELRMTLGAASDRERHIEAVETAAMEGLSKVWTKADAFTHWLSNHYMAFFNLLVAIYVGLPFLAPVLMKTGATGPAKMIYRGYGMVCHQLGYRSFFLFGEQSVYPRTAAGVPDVIPFGQATGLSEGNDVADVYAARNFVGNETVGYKIALCERDVAIYGAMLLFGMAFALAGRNLPALPWYLWVLIGLVPIGIDGVSQLISQPPFNLIAYRESTPFFRVLTGGLFGFATAWFGYPLVEVTMADTRRIMSLKKRRIARAAQQASSEA